MIKTGSLINNINVRFWTKISAHKSLASSPDRKPVNHYLAIQLHYLTLIFIMSAPVFHEFLDRSKSRKFSPVFNNFYLHWIRFS